MWVCSWVASESPPVAVRKDSTDHCAYSPRSELRRGSSSRMAGSSTWMTRAPAASRSAHSSRMARATWWAVAASGWSSRTKDQASIVTGPVSMPSRACP